MGSDGSCPDGLVSKCPVAGTTGAPTTTTTPAPGLVTGTDFSSTTVLLLDSCTASVFLHYSILYRESDRRQLQVRQSELQVQHDGQVHVRL